MLVSEETLGDAALLPNKRAQGTNDRFIAEHEERYAGLVVSRKRLYPRKIEVHEQES